MRSGQWKVILWDLVRRRRVTLATRPIVNKICADSNLSEYNFEGMRQKMLLLCCWTYIDDAKDREANERYA